MSEASLTLRLHTAPNCPRKRAVSGNLEAPLPIVHHPSACAATSTSPPPQPQKHTPPQNVKLTTSAFLDIPRNTTQSPTLIQIWPCREPRGGSTCPRWCTPSPRCTPLPSCQSPRECLRGCLRGSLSQASSSPDPACRCTPWAGAEACPPFRAGGADACPPAQSADRPQAHLAFPAASRCDTVPRQAFIATCTWG